jgi:uncharacterized protein (DUF2062 family)
MPRKLFKRFSPEPKQLRQHQHLKWLGQVLHEPYLWSFGRKNIARAFFIGSFCCMLPIPFQMVLAVVLCISWQANLPIAIGLVWISNPITMPAILYINYKFGNWLLNLSAQDHQFIFSLQWLTQQIEHIWQPILLGSIISGIVVGICSYAIVHLLWIWRIRRTWKKRHQR